MHDARLNFVLQEFIAPEYIEAECSDYLLTENQDSGYTELTLHVKGENICIAQYDKKNRCGFWNRGQRNGLSKCVDHAILQRVGDSWILHMIEMKGRMDNRKWVEEPSELSGYAGAMCGLGDSHQGGVCLYDICGKSIQYDGASHESTYDGSSLGKTIHRSGQGMDSGEDACDCWVERGTCDPASSCPDEASERRAER